MLDETTIYGSSSERKSGSGLSLPLDGGNGEAASGIEIERFCSALLSSIRNNSLPGPFGRHIYGELGRVLREGVRHLESTLQQELTQFDATLAHLQSVSHSKLFPVSERTAEFIAELTRARQSAIDLIQTFRALNSSDAQPPIIVHRPIDRAQSLEEAPAIAIEPWRLDETKTENSDAAEIAETVLQFCRQGDHFRRQQEFVQAEACYCEAIERDPNCLYAFSKRGLVYLLVGEINFAIDDFNFVLELNENNTDVLSLRGDSHAKAGDYEQAVSDYRQALQIDPTLVKTRFNCGIALRRMEHWSEALAEFNAVLESDPMHAAAHYNRGLIHLEFGSLADAISEFQNALRCKNDYPDAREQLRLALQRQRETDQPSSEPEQTIQDDADKTSGGQTDANHRVPVQCPACGTMGLLNWNRLDKVVVCQQCHRSFGVRTDGKTVEVVRASDGRWVDLQAVQNKTSQSRRRLLIKSAVAVCVIPLVALLFWKVSYATNKPTAAKELPKDLNARTELFADAWLRNDVPLMKRLTVPSLDRTLYTWYRKNRPPISRPEGIQPSLPKGIQFETTSKKAGAQSTLIQMKISGLDELGGTVKSVELPLNWQEAGDTWYFQPVIR